MKLLSCRIENFGKISQTSFNFSEGLHIINQQNGWGKSTLAAFIKVMFYGFEGERKQSFIQNERKRYQPWQGGTYGGNLSFEINQKKYEISRSFGSKSSKDFFELRDLETNLISEDYSHFIGEEIFGLDSESFVRTIFISQNESKNVETTADIHAKLGNLVDVSMDIGEYDNAIKRIDKKLTEYNGRTCEYSLSRLRELISMQKEQVRQSGQLEKKAASLVDLKLTLKSKLEDLKVNQRNTQNQRDELLQKRNDVQAKQMAKQMNQDFLFKNISEKKQLITDYQQQYQNWDSNHEDQQLKKIKVLVFLGIFLLVMAIITSFKSIFVGLFFLLSSILLIFFYIFNVKNRQTTKINRLLELKRSIDLLQKEISSLEIQYQQILKSEINQDQIEHKLFQLEQEIAKIDQQIENLNQQKINYDQDLILLQSQQEELAFVANQLAENQLKYNQALTKQKLLLDTKYYLEQAKISFMEKYRNPILKGFEKYYQQLSPLAKEFHNYRIDANMHLTIEQMGTQREIESLSSGYQDFVGLVMRMALIEAMFTNEKPFMIMDDPFVNWDKIRVKKGLDFLQEISKEYQIIYFTCHESRM